MTTTYAAPTKTEAFPTSATIAWLTVGVVVAAAFLCTMDRLVLNLLVDPIRKDLRISETQFSLLQGASFTIINSLAALPIGLLADRGSRRFILMAGVAIWSLATTLGGLSHTFTGFFAARMFVGLGEAALWPVAVSLIANLLPPDKRGRAISLVLLGQILGSGASLIMTGVVVRLAGDHAFAGVPTLATLAPWRIVLVMWGALGLPVIAALLILREPRRLTTRQSADTVGMRSFLAFLGKHRGTLWPMYIGAGFVSIGSYALAAWAPAFFIRRFGLGPAQLGPILGIIGICGGVIGTMLAGALADRQERLGRPETKLTLLMVVALACAAVAALCLAPNLTVALAIQGGSLILFPIVGTLNIIAVQQFAPDEMRGKAMAVLALFSSLFGATLGPTLVAMATQHIFGSDAKVGYAIALVLGPAMLGAAVCFWRVRSAASRLGTPLP